MGLVLRRWRRGMHADTRQLAVGCMPGVGGWVAPLIALQGACTHRLSLTLCAGPAAWCALLLLRRDLPCCGEF